MYSIKKWLRHPESVSRVLRCSSCTNFPREYKLLQKDTIVYRECLVSEYRGFGVYSTNKIGSRWKIFITN